MSEKQQTPFETLAYHMSGAGEVLQGLVGDKRVLARLNPVEASHLIAALEDMMHAWDCLEHVAGKGPAVPGVTLLGSLLPADGVAH